MRLDLHPPLAARRLFDDQQLVVCSRLCLGEALAVLAVQGVQVVPEVLAVQGALAVPEVREVQRALSPRHD